MATALDAFKKEAMKNIKFAGGLGIFGLAYGASELKGISEADNKFKALLKTLKDFILIRASMIGVFAGISGAVRAMVKDTGSLEALLKRMQTAQLFTRIFTPFAGSARAARQHVADLLILSQRTPFKFESFAEADRTLQGLTRGAFAGTGALQTIGDAAAKSGNGIEESARAVGSFYAALKNGEPINSAVNEMRQMGLISDTAATHLERLAESGASSIEMTNNLSHALEQSRGGMSEYAKSLEGITAAHEKAVEAAKIAFAGGAGGQMGAAKAEAKNVQNYTTAIVAMTPALQTAGTGLAALTDGFARQKSELVKWLSTSQIAKGLLAALPGLIVAAGVALTTIGITGIVGLTVAATALNPILGAIVAALGALTIAFTGGGLIRGIKNLVKSMSEVNQLNEMIKAHRKAQAAIDAHAASIETLSDLHEQYGRVVSHIIDLQNQLNAASAKGSTKQVDEIVRAMLEARRKLGQLGPMANLLASPERGAVIQQRIEERMATERARFQESLRAEPGRAPELRRERAGVLEARAARGTAGLEARERVAEQQAGLQGTRAAIEAVKGTVETWAAGTRGTAVPGGPVKTREEHIKDAEKALGDVDTKLNEVAIKFGGTTAVGLEAQARKLEGAVFRGEVKGPQAGQRIQDLRAMAQEQAKYEADATTNAMEARAEREDAIQEERGRKVTEIQTGAARSEVQMRLAGATQEAQKFQDIGSFTTKFEQYRQQFDEQTAKKMALADVQTELMGKSAHDLIAAEKPIADSMAKIGGGGGIGGPTGDPRVLIQQRMAALQENANRILAEIAANTARSGTPEAGGVGAPAEKAMAPPVQTSIEASPTSALPYTVLPPEEGMAKTAKGPIKYEVAGGTAGPAGGLTFGGGTVGTYNPAPLENMNPPLAIDTYSVSPPTLTDQMAVFQEQQMQARLAQQAQMGAERRRGAFGKAAAWNIPVPLPGLGGEAQDNQPSIQYSMLSTLKSIDRTNKQSVEHLGVISDNSGFGAK